MAARSPDVARSTGGVFAVLEAGGRVLRTLALSEHHPHPPAGCVVRTVDDEAALETLLGAAHSERVECRTSIGGVESLNSPDVWAPRALRVVRRS